LHHAMSTLHGPELVGIFVSFLHSEILQRHMCSFHLFFSISEAQTGASSHACVGTEEGPSGDGQGKELRQRGGESEWESDDSAPSPRSEIPVSKAGKLKRSERLRRGRRIGGGGGARRLSSQLPVRVPWSALAQPVSSLRLLLPSSVQPRTTLYPSPSI
jgi:hypothetical protein